jgi:hypothetical protein
MTMKKNGVEIVGGSIELECPYCNTRAGCAALDAREDLMGQYNAELWLGSVDWSGLTDLADYDSDRSLAVSTLSLS